MADSKFLLRLALLGLLIVASFAHPLLWLVVLFGFGAILEGGKRPAANARPELPAHISVERYISAGDPQWRQRLRKRCGSPAEVAFLDAAIDAFDLRPEAGVLQGGGLRLDLQVELASYRVDFLAQDWLVIEIDGAAWHSLASAIERDRRRDEDLRSRNLSILRLPAKLVFQNPREAIVRVQAALEKGRPQSTPPSDTAEKQPSPSRMAKAGSMLEELSSNLERVKAVRAAMAGPEMVYHKEKLAIDRAIDIARRKLEVDDYVGTDQVKRIAFEESDKRLREQLQQYHSRKIQVSGRAERSEDNLLIPAMEMPPQCAPNPANDSIQHAYRNLMTERTTYLSQQRARLRDDPRLSKLVRASLSGTGYPQLWGLIAPEH